MQSDKLNELKVLWRQGTQQSDRFLPELDPSSIRLMDLDPQDWLVFAKNFARFIPFFSERFPSHVIGDWSRFFESILGTEPVPEKGSNAYIQLKNNLNRTLRQFEEKAAMSPHLGLFYVFLQLMEWPRKRLNGLTTSHLDFYYKELLQFKKKKAVPDRVFLQLELAKLQQVFVPKGTLFEGGKDQAGKRRVYKSSYDFFPNQAKIAAVKNRFTDGTTKRVFHSQIANSFDGKGDGFPDNNMRWWPFGHTLSNPALDVSGFGFTLGNKHFLTPSGASRHIHLEFLFLNNFQINLTPQEIVAFFDCEVSGEKGWVPVKPVTQTGKSGYQSHMGSKKLQLAFLLDAEFPATVGADPKIHDSIEMGGLPLLRFTMKVGSSRAYDFLKGISVNPLVSISVKTSVHGIHFPELESDQGVIQAGKPFMPFTSYPKKGSSFYVKEPSWKDKRITGISLHLKWANTPDSFRDLYFGYRDLGNENLSKDSYVAQHFVLQGLTGTIKNLMLTPSAFNNALINNQVKVNESPGNLIVNDDGYFTYDISVRNAVNWSTIETERTLFSKSESEYFTHFEISSSNGLAAREGLRVTLNKSFLHELFPRFYALAMASEHPETLIPNEPYTPLVEQITLGYDTAESYLMNQSNEMMLFLTDDFGFFEEKKTRKDKLPHVQQKRAQLFSFPRNAGGELFINLQDLQKGQQIDLLFQVFEGSENPLHSTFLPRDKMRWYVLSDDYWFPLENHHLISDATDNLLRSGIIRFQLPDEAFGLHSRMVANGVWLRAFSPKPFDATCQLVEILPQVVEAVFENQDNELSHLEKGLPAKTISKMQERVSGVKSVVQPYNSFGARPKESDRGFYIRASERLRHKNRAVSLWDYEHLVLEAFPEVHKAKCLNHTRNDVFMAPGHVMVLVIPDTVDKNVYDIFQPRFSTAKLNEIHAFLAERISPGVSLIVDNPAYEEVRVQLAVKFKTGLDPIFYRNKIEEDIITYLSPWTLKEANSISFGVDLQESLLIHYLESLSYLDYLKDIVLFKNDQAVRKRMEPSSPRHILVSSKNHSIQLI